MAELPELPARIRRLHALRRNELLEKLGFAGDHLKWHESPAKRRAAAQPRHSLLPPPTMAAGRAGRVTHRVNGEEVSYNEWKEHQMAEWAARESDPDVIDSIGVNETISLAKARLAGIMGDYLSFWAEGNGNSDDFAGWVPAIVGLVEREVAGVWQATQRHAAWFDRACRKPVLEGLMPLTKEWQSRASRLEIQHLENPHLSIPSLLAANGNLNLAFTLEQGQQTIDSAQKFLRELRTADERPKHGDRESPDESGAAAANKRAQETIETIDPFADTSSRQPLGDNPFAENDPRHARFDEANWEAERELADLKLELFRRFQESTKAPPDVLQLLLTYRLTRFDVIATKALRTVDGSETARGFEDWLRNFGKFEFEDILRNLSLQTHAYPEGLTPLLDVEAFRLMLMQKVEQHNTAALSIVQTIGAKAPESDSPPSMPSDRGDVSPERSCAERPQESSDDVEQPGRVSRNLTQPLDGSQVVFETAELPSGLRNVLSEFVTSARALESLDIPDIAAALQPLTDAASAIDGIASSYSLTAIQEALDASACALEGLDREAIDRVLKSIESVSQASSPIHGDRDLIASNLTALRDVGARVLASLDLRDLTGMFQPLEEATRATQAVVTAVQRVQEGVAAKPGGSEPNPGATSTPVGEVPLESGVPKPGELIERYLVAHPEIPNHEALADRIGISRDVLFAIKGEIRWVRSAAYECTAILIGCAEQDLHPRSVVRRRRKGKSNYKSNSQSD
jgi:hypothetical protein